MVPPRVIYHGGQEGESARSDWQACAVSLRRPDLRQEADELAGKVAGLWSDGFG